jgi:hypothetical protein
VFCIFLDDRELLSQYLVFGLKLRDVGTNGCQCFLDLSFDKARHDMLRTIPIERFKMQQKTALRLGPIARQRQGLRRFG